MDQMQVNKKIKIKVNIDINQKAIQENIYKILNNN